MPLVDNTRQLIKILVTEMGCLKVRSHKLLNIIGFCQCSYSSEFYGSIFIADNITSVIEHGDVKLVLF